MRTSANQQKIIQQTTSDKPVIYNQALSGQRYGIDSIHYLQSTIGNQGVEQLLQAYTLDLKNESCTNAQSLSSHDFSRIPANAGTHMRAQENSIVDLGMQSGGLAYATIPVVTATAMENEGKIGSEVFEGDPMCIKAESADQTPAPLNEDGLIDGEWTSEVAAHTFVNGGKTGSAIVNWVGGTGGTTPGVGAVTLVAPVIETSGPSAAGGTAQAWVRAGTGTATVSRYYIGVLVGANGPNYYITANAAARIDTHEENHIAHSRTNHDTHITPLEGRIAQHTGQAKSLNQGANEAAARTALETFLDWNNSIANFRNSDTADNIPGGTVDTTDSASPGWYVDKGPRTIGGVNYAHYVDT